MYKKFGVATLGVILLGFGLTGLGWAEEEVCIPIQGKIFNNAQRPGSTLGIVHITFAKEKFKCGLRGDGKLQNPEDPKDIGPLNFDHTLVCDDNAGTSDPIHSQLIFDTSGYPTTSPVDCGNGLQSFSFLEESEPVLGTGTGRFKGVTGGSLIIEGTLFCTLAIDMKFSGELCFQSN